jgi:hypothetical protein
MITATMANGMASSDSAVAEIPDVERALDEAVEPLERDVVDVDDRDAVQVFEPRLQRDDLQQVGHDLDVDHLAADDLEQLQHPHVLFGRQRHVEVIHALAARDLAGLVERAEDRQPAMPEVVAPRPVVDEADDVVAQLAVLENSVRDEAAELAGARDENPLQPDAGAPPALERLAHQLARCERQQHVEGEEERPDDLRHLVRAAILELVGNVVRLEVQRGDDPEHDGEDAADEDGEEVVDARAPAPQTVEALDVEREGHQHADERQHVDVLAERREALRDGDEAALEPQHVREHEGRDAEDGV